MSATTDEYAMTRRGAFGPQARMRRTVIWVAIAFVVGLGVVQRVAPNVLEQPLPLIKGPRGIWVYVNPVRAWSVAFPGSWHPATKTFVGGQGSYRGSSWITLTNLAVHLDEMFDGRGMDPRLVAMQVRHTAPGRHFVILCRTDTRLPLTLKGTNQLRRDPIRDAAGGEVTFLFKAFSQGGEPFNHVSVWVGSQASPHDIDTMEAIVGSINYTPTGNAAYGSADCGDGIPEF